ncbi:MAG: hypothetical protein IJD05_02575, partial [Bacteroidaceae bacterium]|nr:hypothetical protein [Bacteroidaceae bacterium]
MPAECENALFEAVRCFSGIYGSEKEKTTNDFHRLSLFLFYFRKYLRNSVPPQINHFHTLPAHEKIK